MRRLHLQRWIRRLAPRPVDPRFLAVPARGTGGLVIVVGMLPKGVASTITLEAGGTLQIGTGTTAAGV